MPKRPIGTGVLKMRDKIPKSSLKCFEVELQVATVEGLSPDVAYTDGVIKTKLAGLTPIGKPNTLQRKGLESTPQWSFGVGPDYERPVSGDLAPFLGASLNYQSDPHAGYNLSDKYFVSNTNYLDDFTHPLTGKSRTYGVSVGFHI